MIGQAVLLLLVLALDVVWSAFETPTQRCWRVVVCGIFAIALGSTTAFSVAAIEATVLTIVPLRREAGRV